MACPELVAELPQESRVAIVQRKPTGEAPSAPIAALGRWLAGSCPSSLRLQVLQNGGNDVSPQ